MYASDDLRAYRKARRVFSLKTYGLLALWLLLALIQWLVVVLIADARDTFDEYYYICLVTFALAVVLFAIFIFIERLRFVKGLNFIFALLIVELQIISTFALVARSWLIEVLAFYAVAVVLVVIFLIIGIILPRKMDLTLDIAVLFIIAFVFLIVATFLLAVQLCIEETKPYAYLVVELAITLTILLFVMYHGQTIHGNRFAEMRLNDFFLGSLILFHDFLIIYWLTFYWQIHHRPFPRATSTTPNSTFTKIFHPGAVNTGWEDMRLPTPPPRQPWDEKGDEWGQDHRGPPRYPPTPSDPGRDGNWGNDGYRDNDGRDRLRQRPRPVTKAWFVYEGREHPVDDDQPVPVIEKPGPHGRNGLVHGVLYKARPYDGRNYPVTEDDSGDQSNDNAQRRYTIEGPASENRKAKGKPEAGPGNPSIDFPLADHRPELQPASKERGYLPKSLVEMTPPKENFKVNPLKIHPREKLNELGDQPEEPEKILQESRKAAPIEPNLLGDEMRGSEVTTKAVIVYREGLTPEWEVLSPDELRKLSNSQIVRRTEEDRTNPQAEPLITANPYVLTQLPNFEKLVINNSSPILK